MSTRWPLRALILAGYALGVIALAVGLPEEMPPSWTLPGSAPCGWARRWPPSCCRRRRP